MNCEFSRQKAVKCVAVVFFVLCVSCAIIIQANASERVDRLIETMTLQEKVGQLFMLCFEGSALSEDFKQIIHNCGLGGVILYNVTNNIQNSEQVANLVNQIQEEAVASGAGVPLFVGIDQEGGLVARLRDGFTDFPGNMALAASGSSDNAEKAAFITGQELKAVGVNFNFAPVVDVNSNPLNPIIGLRSFGSSPETVASYGLAALRGYTRAGIIATAKHFPGHGDTDFDSHMGLPVVSHDIARLEKVEFFPFKAMIDAGVDAIMTAHVEIPALEEQKGLPATLSKNVLSVLLRQKMGFEGLIVTDSMGMGAIVNEYGVAIAAEKALNAGADVLVYGADKGWSPNLQMEAYNHILSLALSGDISIERLNDSIRKILSVKEKYGILDWEKSDFSVEKEKIATKDSLAFAKNIARESITLIRDVKGFLPLKKDEPLLIVWPDKRLELASIIAAPSKNAKISPMPYDPSSDDIERIIQEATSFKNILVGAYDASKHPAQIVIIRKLMSKNLIVAAIRSPYDIMSFNDIPCYLISYGFTPFSMEALRDVLWGSYRPVGQLPIAIPGVK